jgi:hypothetical protein
MVFKTCMNRKERMRQLERALKRLGCIGHTRERLQGSRGEMGESSW